MLADLNEFHKRWIEKTISEMTIEEKVAQVMSWSGGHLSDKEILQTLQEVPFGSIFFNYNTTERCREITDMIQGKTKIPVITCADLENGLGSRMEGGTIFPWLLGCGASDSEELTEEMGEATALEGRNCGIHWTLGPVIDLNINYHNGMSCIRSFGEKPEHVIRMARAFTRGIQRDGLMAATAKHFPGDGVDDRDPHVSTVLNDLNREQWYESYGKVWKAIIEEGVMTIMSGHIGLPFIDPGAKPYLGPTPATLSSKIQIDFLRNELGFDGLIVSDAIPMAGFSAHTSPRKRAADNIRTGSDMVLWARPEEDFPWMLEAVNKGDVSIERLNDAVRRVLELKAKIGLLNKSETPKLSSEDKIRFERCSEQIAERSVTIIRNEGNLIPLSLDKGAKILTASCQFEEKLRGTVQELDVVDQELKKRGFIVDHLKNPVGHDLCKIASNYDVVFMNIHVLPHYGTIFMTDTLARVFWDSFWPEHPCVIFTSFGDPYKIYEIPSVPNMINVYGSSPCSQRAAVKVWFGEIPAKGKSPVQLKGFFDIEV